MSSVIFYGAGQHAKANFARWLKAGLTPVCFVDSDISKHYTNCIWETVLLCEV